MNRENNEEEQRLIEEQRLRYFRAHFKATFIGYDDSSVASSTDVLAASVEMGVSSHSNTKSISDSGTKKKGRRRFFGLGNFFNLKKKDNPLKREISKKKEFTSVEPEKTNLNSPLSMNSKHSMPPTLVTNDTPLRSTIDPRSNSGSIKKESSSNSYVKVFEEEAQEWPDDEMEEDLKNKPHENIEKDITIPSNYKRKKENTQRKIISKKATGKGYLKLN